MPTRDVDTRHHESLFLSLSRDFFFRYFTFFLPVHFLFRGLPPLAAAAAAVRHLRQVRVGLRRRRIQGLVVSVQRPADQLTLYLTLLQHWISVIIAAIAAHDLLLEGKTLFVVIL